MKTSTFKQASIRSAAGIGIFLISLSGSANTDPFSGKFFELPIMSLDSDAASAVISKGQNTLKTGVFVSYNSDSAPIDWELQNSVFDRNEP